MLRHGFAIDVLEPNELGQGKSKVDIAEPEHDAAIQSSKQSRRVETLHVYNLKTHVRNNVCLKRTRCFRALAVRSKTILTESTHGTNKRERPLVIVGSSSQKMHENQHLES